MSSDPYDAALLAESLRGLGRIDQARDVLAEALGEHPDSAVLLAELSAVLRQQGDVRGGEQAARDAVALAPTTPLPLLRLSFSLLTQGRVDEAAQVAQSVIALDPNQSAAWSYLALAGAGKRKPADRAVARQAYRRAIELAPGESRLRATAAIVERAFGNTDEARRLVADGLSIDPQSGTLLGLRAEYAPVAQQPALLVDVLTANPTDEESRELLDAAVTWERRVALTAPLVLPVLLAVVVEVGGGPIAACLLAAACIAAGVLVRRRYRRRLAVLPAGYLAVRRSAARGTAAMRILIVTAAGVGVLGALADWIARPAAEALLTLSILAGAAAVAVGLPDDQRVLATARRRSGRVRGGTAWRFGSLRQELTLWTALGTGVLGLAGGAAALATDADADAGATGAVVLATALMLVLLLVEAAAAGINAPHRYLRRAAVRYRFAIATAMTFALTVLGLGALAPSALDSVPPPPGVEVPTFTPLPTISIPTFDVPTFAPITIPPLDSSSPEAAPVADQAPRAGQRRGRRTNGPDPSSARSAFLRPLGPSPPGVAPLALGGR